MADLADQAQDVADAYVTLLVYAGIAAAHVIGCARLGECAHGANHNEAVALLRSADADAARHLETLLKMKTRVGYGHTPASHEDLKKGAACWGCAPQGSPRALTGSWLDSC